MTLKKTKVSIGHYIKSMMWHSIKIITLLLILLYHQPGFAQSDSTPPILKSFTFEPQTIDVSNSPDTVTAYIGATDDFIGTNGVSFDFVSPAGVKRFDTGSRLIDGTNMDGVYFSQVIIPKYSQAGDWKVGYVYLSDSLNNWIKYTTSDLINLGFPTILTVEDDISDITAPEVQNFTFYPNAIDVSDSAINITISLHITDNSSGCNGAMVSFFSPSGTDRTGNANLVSGTNINGIFEGTVTFPQFSAAGDWTVGWIYLSDYLNNSTYYHTPDLVNSNFPTILNVSSTSTNVSDNGLSFSFMLKQNYPNPFNPITKISYSIPQINYVTIKVFNLLGKEIVTLVNEEKAIGNYEVEFDCGNITSGIYFYRMQAGNFSETKKLILLR